MTFKKNSVWIYSALLLLFSTTLGSLGLFPVVLLLALLILIISLYCYVNFTPWYSLVFSWIFVLLTGVILAIYRPEGFSYPLLFSVDSLYPNGKEFSLYLNLGKLMGGLAILIWLIHQSETRAIRKLKAMDIIICAFIVLVILSYAFFILKLDFVFKLSLLTLVFVTNNLLITSFSEEIFYRWIIQRPSENLVTKTKPKLLVGVISSTVFFTLTHFSFNITELSVMMTAGLGYALVYALTNRLWMCVLVHASVNTIHFIFLQYPI